MRDKEVSREPVYSPTITRCMQLQFATDLADFGERMAKNDKSWPLEALRRRDAETRPQQAHQR